MTDAAKAQQQRFAQETLTPVVRRALDRETAEVVDWERHELHAGAGVITSIHRFAGTARDGTETIPWSLILKVIVSSPGFEKPSNAHYWKREPWAYQSGFFAQLPTGLTTPRSYDVVHHRASPPQVDEAWIWMEELADEIGQRWPLEHYGRVARQFGQFNGQYLNGEPLPSWPWLSAGWLRAAIEEAAPAIALLRESLDEPLVRRWLPGSSAERIFRLWEEREVYLAALDQLPQTLCHHDAFRRNLFARGCDHAGKDCDETAVIDWAFVGRGAVGEEMAPLVAASLGFFEVDITHAQELDGIVFEGYLQGLRDAGWDGDPRRARLGFAAASAVRYPLASVPRVLPFVLDRELTPAMEQVFGHPAEEVMDRFAAQGEFLARYAAEARELMAALA